jgi:hypothetical protein
MSVTDFYYYIFFLFLKLLEEFNNFSLLFKNQNFGKRSELQKSQRRKPERTLKNLETITTSKMAF